MILPHQGGERSCLCKLFGVYMLTMMLIMTKLSLVRHAITYNHWLSSLVGGAYVA